MTEHEAAVAHRHRAIFESAVDFAIIASDTEGRITDWNPGAVRILGWTAAEMAGEAADRIFTDEDRAQDPAAEMRRALETGGVSEERWHVRKDGSRFWADSEMMPLRGEGGAHLGFFKVLRDRTEQRQAEEARAAEAAFLQSVLASSGDCIKVLDLDGKLTFMSEGGQRVMEVSDFNATGAAPGLIFGRARATSGPGPRWMPQRPAGPDASRAWPRRWRARPSTGTCRSRRSPARTGGRTGCCPCRATSLRRSRPRRRCARPRA